jgi:predicted nucleic acid-binding protein
MKTAIDSNILIDVIGKRSSFTPKSTLALDHALSTGALILCPVVASEIASHYETAHDMKTALRAMQIELVPLTIENLHSAGLAYIQYKNKVNPLKPEC